MKIKVLVVDDNEGIVNLIKEYFKDNDKIEIIGSASNGQIAIDLFNNNIEYDLMLLDLVMPVKDGLSVLEYMKENNITTKVRVMTSYNEEETIREGRE